MITAVNLDNGQMFDICTDFLSVLQILIVLMTTNESVHFIIAIRVILIRNIVNGHFLSFEIYRVIYLTVFPIFIALNHFLEKFRASMMKLLDIFEEKTLLMRFKG